MLKTFSARYNINHHMKAKVQENIWRNKGDNEESRQ
jgi:hypothetical protein